MASELPDIVMPDPDWYSDGFQILSQPFNHNGFEARALFTEQTLRRALVAAERAGMEKAAKVADEHQKNAEGLYREKKEGDFGRVAVGVAGNYAWQIAKAIRAGIDQ